MRKYKDLEEMLQQLFDEQEAYDDQKREEYWTHVDDVYDKCKNMEEE